MPTFAEGQQRHDQIVAAGVGGDVAPGPPAVGDRIDREGAVIDDDRRHKEAAEHRAPAAKVQTQHRQQHRRQQPMAIEKAQVAGLMMLQATAEGGRKVAIGLRRLFA